VALAAFDGLKSDPYISKDVAMATQHASVGIQALKIACNQLGGGAATSVYLNTKIDAVADAALKVLVDSGLINNFNFSICKDRNRFAQALDEIYDTQILQNALKQLGQNSDDSNTSPDFSGKDKAELIKAHINELSRLDDDGPAGVSSADANPGARTLQ
jgi:hypothetical protein